MEAQFPEEESEEAREGTAAHEYASTYLNHGVILQPGALASNGIPITLDMITSAAEYIEDCIADRNAGGECYVEQRVFMHKSVHPQNDGTPDHFAVWRNKKVVKLKDYKHGHRYVDVFRNWQLADYLIGIFETLQLGPFEGWHIEAAIYQPRNYHPEGHVRVWRPTPPQLEWMRAELAESAMVATTPGAQCITGAHCKDCTAISGCATNLEMASALVDMSGRQVPHVLDNNALGKELRMLRAASQRLKARVEGLEEQAINRIAQGQRVSHFTAEHSYGREKFTLPPEKVIMWCDAFGINARAPVATLTPAQLRKAGMSDNNMPPSEKPRGAYTLVEVTPHSLAKGMSDGR